MNDTSLYVGNAGYMPLDKTGRAPQRDSLRACAATVYTICGYEWRLCPLSKADEETQPRRARTLFPYDDGRVFSLFSFRLEVTRRRPEIGLV